MPSAPIFLPDFSHIYVEEEALDYPLTRKMLERFFRSVHITIKDYKNYFNRGGQNFQLQKQSIKLILAVKKPPFLYPVSEIHQSGNYQNHCYTTPLINCLYNCDYCFLQGMYPAGNMVLFVNEEDFFQAVLARLQNGYSPENPLLVSPAYNTDLMAMESLVPLTRSWIEFSRKTENLALEIRTKSGLFKTLAALSPVPQVLLAWTLSPTRVIRSHEFGTPSLSRRLAVVVQALNRGWRVRLCFDPVLLYEGWKEDYFEFFNRVFTALPADRIEDVTVGIFRMNRDFFQRIRKQRPKSGLYYQTYDLHGNTITLPREKQKWMRDYLKSALTRFLPAEKVLFWI